MAADYDVVTFACYGTLIDWEAGIGAALADLAARSGVAVDAQAALAAYAATEPLVQAGEFLPYRAVLAETARRAAAEVGWPMDDDTAARFAATLPQWPPFADANPALARIAAAYRLGMLANVDDDLLRGTLRQLAVPFQVLVTSEQVRSYKPDPGHFLAARERIGGLRWLHVAQGYARDIVPAGRLGLPVVWVNRKDEALPAAGPSPLAVVAGLAELADWLRV